MARCPSRKLNVIDDSLLCLIDYQNLLGPRSDVEQGLCPGVGGAESDQCANEPPNGSDSQCRASTVNGSQHGLWKYEVDVAPIFGRASALAGPAGIVVEVVGHLGGPEAAH